VLLLTGFLATILMRVLKNDFIKYTNVRDDEALEDGEETGWKVGFGGQARWCGNRGAAGGHRVTTCWIVGAADCRASVESADQTALMLHLPATHPSSPSRLLHLASPPPPRCLQLVHGDVFRFPTNLNLFCAVVGTGTQILVMVSTNASREASSCWGQLLGHPPCARPDRKSVV